MQNKKRLVLNDKRNNKRIGSNLLKYNYLGVLILTFCFSQPIAGFAKNKEFNFIHDQQTIFVLNPSKNGTMKDSKHNFMVATIGARTVQDKEKGTVLQFDNSQNIITVRDDGKMDFSKGVTVEMWIQLLEVQAGKQSELYVKPGSFAGIIKNEKLKCAWISFPTVPVFTTTDLQYKDYPVGGTGFGGAIPLKKKQWHYLAFTYDPVLKVARTYIDNQLDQTRYYSRIEDLTLQQNKARVMRFFKGMKNIKIGSIRVSKSARAITPLPFLECYGNSLGYRNAIAITLDQINPNTLPLDVEIYWHPANGNNTLQQKVRLTNAARKDITFKPSGSLGHANVTVKAFFNKKQVFTKEIDMVHFNGTKEVVKLDIYNRLIINNKPSFPLIAYHAFEEDLNTLKNIGFTMVTPRWSNSNSMGLIARDEESAALTKHFLNMAKVNGIQLAMKVNSKIAMGLDLFYNHKALGIWYAADEPYGEQLANLRNNYNFIKSKTTTRPIFVVQNNTSRLQETAEGTDILACDPFPIPKQSLRYVADFTKACIRAVDNLKPVWTIIPQYQGKIPTEQELRCMAYLAIVSGANGLGVYAWDDRNAKTKKGWYTLSNSKAISNLKSVIGELSQMQDILTIPNAKQYKINISSLNPAIHTAVKKSENTTYIFLVNDSRKAESTKISILGILDATGIDIKNEKNELRIQNGKALINLPALGVQVYKF